MTDMDFSAIDLDTATMDELENLSLADLLGQDISDVNLSSSLPDGTFIGLIESYELTKRAAKPEENKKASVTLAVKIKVAKTYHLTDPNLDPTDYEGRVHFERFGLLSDFGKANLVKLLLGAVGVSFTDKKAIADVAKSTLTLLEELKAHNVYFGFTVKTTERNGFENCNIVMKTDKFIPMEQAVELMA